MKLNERTARVLGVVLVLGAAVGFVLVPMYARRTEISDRSLLPDTTRSTFSKEDMKYAAELTLEIAGQGSREAQARRIAEEMAGLGIEPHIFKDSKAVWGVFMAPNAGGKESVAVAGRVRVGPGDVAMLRGMESAAARSGAYAADGAGMVLAIARHLTRVGTWVAKDFVFVVTLEEDVAHDWVRSYLATGGDGGAIQTALVVDVGPTPTSAFVSGKIHGYGGHVPNQDLFNSLCTIASSTGRGVHSFSMSDSGFPDNGLTRFAADVVEPRLERAVQSAAFGGRRHLAVAFMSNLKDMLLFVWKQARGVADGEHAAFSKYRIDSLTIGMTNFSFRVPEPDTAATKQIDVARTAVSLLRSMNSIMTHMHHSYFLYILAGPTLFVSVADYYVVIALAAGGLTLISFARMLGGGATVFGTITALGEMVWYHALAAGLFSLAQELLPHSSGAFCLLALAAYALGAAVPAILQRYYGDAQRASVGNALCMCAAAPMIIYISTVSLTNFSFCFLAALAVFLPVLLHSSLPVNAHGARFVSAALYSPPALASLLASLLHSSPQSLVRTCFLEKAHDDAPLFGFFVFLYLPFCMSSLRLSFAPSAQCGSHTTTAAKDKSE